MGVVQRVWVWCNVCVCGATCVGVVQRVRVLVYLIMSKVGREEGGVPVKDVLQQLCEERERVSYSVATRQYGTRPLVPAAAQGSGTLEHSLECDQTQETTASSYLGTPV